MNIMMIGDIVGRPGRNIVRQILPELRRDYAIDLVIANGENIAGGIGVTRETVAELYNSGVDVITTGNHVWDKKDVFNFIDQDQYIVRPANYPPETPGKGYTIITIDNVNVAVVSLAGRVFMEPLDCPFRTAKDKLDSIHNKADVFIVDFHAEATSEKQALAWFLDGRVSAVCGTHTHVQTNDARILPGGTAFISDVGMTGPYNSVLGVDKDLVIKKFTGQLPVRFEVANGPCQFNAVIVEVDICLGRAKEIETVNFVR
ncbi:TIGR00282 family metallophosphoesterase [Metallumcola ferriviriculae]|uniref:TIGR00282 family metallophosphoesterase n=1 Tax=Metallumcola ferriviriculae TaxID=3039180 RepID=A0AAU0UNH4_9FIRM|nr:TIGR00282 family metallophosphoesterase [Desulfitibacteraceae bacterium MK1]